MRTLLDCSGKEVVLPTFDPFVANHLSLGSSLTDALIHQINDGMYVPLIKNLIAGVFLDIGANTGLVSLYFSVLCKRIVSVEPAPETFRVLEAMTQGRNNIECVQVALAPVDGTVDFYLNDLNTTASSTVNNYGTKTTVRGMTLASILSVHQLESVDVCKIDAEGAEGESLTFEQLKAAAPIIKSYYIETHNCPKDTWQEKLGRIVRDLARLGYNRISIDGMAIRAGCKG